MRRWDLKNNPGVSERRKDAESGLHPTIQLSTGFSVNRRLGMATTWIPRILYTNNLKCWIGKGNYIPGIVFAHIFSCSFGYKYGREKENHICPLELVGRVGFIQRQIQGVGAWVHAAQLTPEGKGAYQEGKKPQTWPEA